MCGEKVLPNLQKTVGGQGGEADTLFLVAL